MTADAGSVLVTTDAARSMHDGTGKPAAYVGPSKGDRTARSILPTLGMGGGRGRYLPKSNGLAAGKKGLPPGLTPLGSGVLI